MSTDGEKEKENAVEVSGKGWKKVAQVTAGKVKVVLPQGWLG